MGFENNKSSKPLSTSEKVLASVIVAGAGVAGAPIAVEKYNTTHHEYISEGALDLGEKLNEKFGTKLQVENENGQYIIHIGQIHGVERSSKEWEEKVVVQQKEMEQLLLELKQRYGVDTVFVEGSSIDYPFEDEKIDLPKALKVYEKFGHAAYLEYILLPNINKIEKQIADFPTDNFDFVDDLGLTSPQMKRRGYVENYNFIETFEDLLQKIISEKSLSNKEKMQCHEILAKLHDLKEKADSTPGYKDLVYLVGGATKKLAQEKQIIEMPAETLGARANPPQTKFQTFGAGADFHETRENVSTIVAYEFALNNPKAKYVPLVYGQAHDFSNNVKAVNELQTDPKYKIGLIRIDYKN